MKKPVVADITQSFYEKHSLLSIILKHRKIRLLMMKQKKFMYGSGQQMNLETAVLILLHSISI